MLWFTGIIKLHCDNFLKFEMPGKSNNFENTIISPVILEYHEAIRMVL